MVAEPDRCRRKGLNGEEFREDGSGVKKKEEGCRKL
jgi:hypothetical protein